MVFQSVMGQMDHIFWGIAAVAYTHLHQVTGCWFDSNVNSCGKLLVWSINYLCNQSIFLSIDLSYFFLSFLILSCLSIYLSLDRSPQYTECVGKPGAINHPNHTSTCVFMARSWQFIPPNYGSCELFTHPQGAKKPLPQVLQTCPPQWPNHQPAVDQPATAQIISKSCCGDLRRTRACLPHRPSENWFQI